jgi:hypothetical protein
MSPDQDFPEDGDAEYMPADVFGNDVCAISVWEDGGDRSLVEKVGKDAIEVASSPDSYNPPRAPPASPFRPPRTPITPRRKMLLEQKGAAACFSRPMRRPPYEPKLPPAAPKMEQQLPVPPMTPRARKKHLALLPLAKRKSATETKSSDSSVVAFPVDWGNTTIVLDEFIKSREPGKPQPQHARRYSESGTIFTPVFPSLDDDPEPVFSPSVRRHSLAYPPDRDNNLSPQVASTLANKNPSDESSLFSDAFDPSKCSQEGSPRHISAGPSVEIYRRRSSSQSKMTHRRPRRNFSAGEQDWSIDCTEAWPVDPSVSSSAELTATDSSPVVEQKRVVNRRLSASSFGENSKESLHNGPNAGAEWSHQIRPSASVVDELKKAFLVRSNPSTEGPCHRRASSLSRKTARRSRGNSIDQGWPTDFAEDTQADPSGRDASKDGSSRIKAGRKIKYEKASKDATDGEDSKSRKSSKSKTSRSSSRSRPPKPTSKDQIKEKKDEQVGRSERKVRRSSLRGDKGGSSREEGENGETGAGPSDTTARDDAAMVFPCVTPMGRKPMLSEKLQRRDDKEEGVAPDVRGLPDPFSPGKSPKRKIKDVRQARAEDTDAVVEPSIPQIGQVTLLCL